MSDMSTATKVLNVLKLDKTLKKLPTITILYVLSLMDLHILTTVKNGIILVGISLLYRYNSYFLIFSQFQIKIYSGELLQCPFGLLFYVDNIRLGTSKSVNY